MWTARYQVTQIKANINKVQKEIGQLKKVRSYGVGTSFGS